MDMIDYFTYSLNRHFLSIYHESGNLRDAREKVRSMTEIFTFDECRTDAVRIRKYPFSKSL